MEQQGRDMLGRHSQVRTGLQQLHEETNIQQHAQAGFFSFRSFVTGMFGLRQKTPIKKIDRDKLQRRAKQRDAMKELEETQAQEHQRWEEGHTASSTSRRKRGFYSSGRSPNRHYCNGRSITTTSTGAASTAAARKEA